MTSKIYLLALAMCSGVQLSSAQTMLNSFTGNQQSMNIQLSWQSATEVNLDYFTLERSLDAITFSAIQNVDALGPSNNPINYTYTDINSFADLCYYYRLKAVQLDGNYQFMDTIQVCYSSTLVSVADLSDPVNSNVYPNPVTNGKLYVEIAEFENCSISILNLNGQVVHTGETASKTTEIDCTEFDKGLYLLRIEKPNGQFGTVNVVIE